MPWLVRTLTVAVVQDTGSQATQQQPVPASHPVVATPASLSSVKAAEVAAEKPRKLWKIATPGAVILALIAAGIFFYFFRQSHKLTAKDTIVLADFDNTSGDAVFEEALKQALAVQLGQSPFLNILSDRRVEDKVCLLNGSDGL